MRFYSRIYRLLNLPVAALRVAEGKVQLRPGVTVPFISGGFPPALIPIWSDDFGYYGFWKHWFCDRSVALVRLRLGEHMEAQEVARSFDQFVILMTLQMLCAGVFTEDRARTTMREAGLMDVDFDAMVQVAENTGDDPAGLIAHHRFRADPPLQVAQDLHCYRGDFPVADRRTTVRRDICGFELPLSTLLELDAPEVSGWLSPPGGFRQQPAVFDSHLRQGDLAGAWLSLNSPAWGAEDARQAIRRLAEEAKDGAFTALAEAWSSERQGGMA